MPSAAKSRGVPTVLDDDEVVLAADRGVRVDEVRQLAEQRGGLGLGRDATRLGGLDALGEVGRAGHGGVDLGLRRGPLVVGRLLQPALQVPDVLRQRVLLAAQRAERGLGGTPQLVGVERARRRRRGPRRGGAGSRALGRGRHGGA